MIAEYVGGHGPDELVSSLGGHGVAAVYQGSQAGPCVLVRCELDALPIPETVDLRYASSSDGISHKCGHDGHMAMVAGLAPELGRERPARGKVVLLFQPAEETGEGAALVLHDRKFHDLRPDLAFALHNLPGYPLGRVVLREGVFAVASRGLIVRFLGATAHAAEPEKGRSPALATADAIHLFSALPQTLAPMNASAKATVIHARLGEIAFGTTPGEAEVMATLRSDTAGVMEEMARAAERIVGGLASIHRLRVETEWTEEFPVTANDPEVVRLVKEAAERAGLDVEVRSHPFPWSEDFGHFTAATKGVLFGLGSGEEQPPLHHPHYDFPDSLLEVGRGLLLEVIRRACA